MRRFSLLAIVVAYVAQAASPTLTTLYSFTGGSDGGNPEAGLLGIGKLLYGTTYAGGTANLGAVFLLTAPAMTGGVWTETVLHSFTGQNGDGSGPLGNLVMGKSGNLYGTTKFGGTGMACHSGCGTVFQLTPAAGGAWTETVLYSFKGRNGDGAEPYAGLLIDSNGVLYGTTYGGGSASNGTAFMLTPPLFPGGNWKETVLHSFTGQSGQDGALPTAALVMDANGVLYGSTDYGGKLGSGAVFQLTPPASGGAWTETVLYSFTGKDGDLPYAGVVLGQNGVLYGTTYSGGSSGRGAVFQLAPGAPGAPWTETVLYSFTGQNGDGAGPFAGLVVATNGVLFGATYGGGNSGKAGTLFKLTPPADPEGAPGSGWTETVLYKFMGPLGGGSGPLASLIMSPAGLLYGTTEYGGSNTLPGFGTVFQLTP